MYFLIFLFFKKEVIYKFLDLHENNHVSRGEGLGGMWKVCGVVGVSWGPMGVMGDHGGHGKSWKAMGSWWSLRDHGGGVIRGHGRP